MHLEDVETGSPLIRQYANQAIALHPERRQVLESVFDTWQAIREGELSDESLECTESRLIAHQLGLPDPEGSEGS